MSCLARKLAITLYFTAIASAIGQAQVISVAPSSESVGVGLKRQYTATVSGLANPAVTWSVAGQGAGNSTVGTIDQNGLYTAPLVPPAQNPVSIYATSMMSPGLRGTAYANVLPAGPTISAVSPNPQPTGTYSITVTGVGFVSGARIIDGGVALTTTFVNSTTLKSTGNWRGNVTSTLVQVYNPGTTGSNILVIPVSGTSSGGSGSAPVVAPSTASVVLGGTQQFAAPAATSWTASAGTVTSTGLYTAPAVMPASSTATVTATNAAGSSSATITLISNTPATITGLGSSPLPLGIFSTTITGTRFIPQSTAKLNSTALITTYVNATTLNVTGFASVSGTAGITVVNGALSSPVFPVQVGIPNAQVTAAAARRFLEQAAFGPTPTDAAHVQAIGMQAWIEEQFAMPQVSNYSALASSSQGKFSTVFLANAVTNADQLRQRVAFALSQIMVTSVNKLIWNQAVIPYQEMLMGNAFSSYRQILGDVTLSPAMGQYLDMANNGKANPATGSVANENYAREVLQLFSIGTTLLNQDGSFQLDANNLPAQAYSQFTITEFARVFTGWTYAPAAGQAAIWGAYPTQNGPMVPYPGQHDTGSKTLLNGTVALAGLSAAADLNFSLDNIANHPNVGPFFCRQLIQHLVKNNPSPAYIQRVADVFANNPQGRGDMKAVIAAILLDPEARANDNGGQDQVTDGHLQEPVLYIAGVVRAFGGQMNVQNYFAYDLSNMGQDIYNPASVFNYYSPLFVAPGTNLFGGEFQIDTPNNAVYRANVIANLFGAYNNPVQTYGPGTTVDLTPFVALAAQPATLVDALDLTLTHGTMPAAMKQQLVSAVTAEAGGSVTRVETGVYLILTSSYYSVWH